MGEFRTCFYFNIRNSHLKFSNILWIRIGYYKCPNLRSLSETEPVLQLDNLYNQKKETCLVLWDGISINYLL